MTFKTTVKDEAGNPIAGVLVVGNNEISGASYCRSTNGDGYADVWMAYSRPTDRYTFYVIDPQGRFKGEVEGDAGVIGDVDIIKEVTLVPFV